MQLFVYFKHALGHWLWNSRQRGCYWLQRAWVRVLSLVILDKMSVNNEEKSFMEKAPGQSSCNQSPSDCSVVVVAVVVPFQYCQLKSPHVGRGPSVTRWLDYMFNIRPFATISIRPKHKQLAKRGSKCCQMLSLKMGQSFCLFSFFSHYNFNTN